MSALDRIGGALTKASESGAAEFLEKNAGVIGDVAGLVSLVPGKEQFELNRMIREERTRMRTAPGMNAQERGEMLGGAAQQAGVAAQAQRAALARQQDNNPNLANKGLQAQGDIADVSAKVAGQAGAAAIDQSAQMAAQRKAHLAQMLAERADSRKENLKTGIKSGLGLAANFATGGSASLVKTAATIAKGIL